MTMSEEEDSSTPVQDGTDLTTLVGPGPDEEYQRLASICFTDTDVGNTKWKAAKTYTMEGFLNAFDAGKPTRRASLHAWIAHYKLENGFKQPEQPNGELLLVLYSNCCFEYGNTVPYSCIRWNGPSATFEKEANTKVIQYLFNVYTFFE
eukprot:scaffold132159_cov50-Attheya_sp.AAC.2